MGFFQSLFGGGSDSRFQSDAAYTQKRARQLAMTPQTMAQLRNYGVTVQSELKLEYFFYTNTQEKASALAQALAEMEYTGSYKMRPAIRSNS